jgi:hypothetical protein
MNMKGKAKKIAVSRAISEIRRNLSIGSLNDASLASGRILEVVWDHYSVGFIAQ